MSTLKCHKVVENVTFKTTSIVSERQVEMFEKVILLLATKHVLESPE